MKSNKLLTCSLNEPLYILKLFQTVRLLTRNKYIHELLFDLNLVNVIDLFLENIVNKQIIANTEMIDNIIIEVISILKRLLNGELKDDKLEIYEKIINSTILDHLIFFLHKDNIIIIKLLHITLISLLKR
jgi:hypothetical protein